MSGAVIAEEKTREAESIVAELMCGRMQDDPYPLYRRLREIAPVYYSSSLKMWFVSGYEGNAELHSDSRVGQGNRSEKLLNDPVYGHSPVMRYIATFMVGIDPPDHTRLRKLVNPVFLPSAMNRLEGKVQGIVNDFLDEAEKAEHPDFHRDFSSRIPMALICDMLGIGRQHFAKWIGWANEIAAIVIVPQPTPEQLRPADEAYASASDFIFQEIEERKKAPSDDLLSALIASEEDGERLNHEELVAMAIQLMVAGSETTTTTIEQGINILLHHPEQLELLRKNPDLDRGAIEEILRYDAPLHVSLYRVALEDTTIEGVAIPKGDMILPLVAAGNRDPRQFPNPDTLDIQRPNARMLSFGRGIHTCLGQWLARIEARVAICTAIRKYPNLRLAAEPQLRGSPASRGLKSLPVILQ